MRKSAGITIALSLSFPLFGCVDQDPFGLSCRPISGNYCLEQWEDNETYYIRARDGHAQTMLEGEVQALAWNDHYILVRPGGVNGYVAIDIQNGILTGPASSIPALGIMEVSTMRTVSPKVAWDRLR